MKMKGVLNMLLIYADQTKMGKINEIGDIWNLSKAVRNGKRIPELLLMDEIVFCEFYEAWIKPCIKFRFPEENISLEERLKKKEEQRSLFFAEAENMEDAEAKYLEFIEAFGTAMRKPVACPVCKREQMTLIRDAITKELDGIPEYMKLRVLVVCMLANELPKNVFEKGESWGIAISGEVHRDIYENEYMNVEDGMQFVMDIQTEEKQNMLFAKILRNDRENACRIMVSYAEKQYTIQMPPYGILRCVFADEACKKLLSIKGNICFHDATNALMLCGEKKDAKLFAYNKRNGIFKSWNPGVYFDISIDGKGGFLVLTAKELYSSMGMSKKTDLPIRCYGSGKQWAWLYADGRLESNLENGKELSHVTAVVEDAEKGLLICNDTGCWDYRGTMKKEIEPSLFMDLMLQRFCSEKKCESVKMCERGKNSDICFCSDEKCESVKSRYVELFVQKDGEVEAERI